MGTDLDRLEALARAALDDPIEWSASRAGADDRTIEDVAYVDALDPAVFLELVKELRELRKWKQDAIDEGAEMDLYD